MMWAFTQQEKTIFNFSFLSDQNIFQLQGIRKRRLRVQQLQWNSYKYMELSTQGIPYRLKLLRKEMRIIVRFSLYHFCHVLMIIKGFWENNYCAKHLFNVQTCFPSYYFWINVQSPNCLQYPRWFPTRNFNFGN